VSFFVHYLGHRRWSMRGKKECPQCKASVAARAGACSCGYKWRDTNPVRKDPVVYDGPGRGRKECSCGKYCGARNETCPACGKIFQKPVEPREATPFPVAPKPEKVHEPREDVSPRAQDRSPVGRSCGNGRRNISTPAGSCPVRLNGDSIECVREWAEKIQAQADAEDVNYSVSALNLTRDSTDSP
jgi:hypothetical protein